MITEDKIKIYKLMCSSIPEVGVSLFKVNNLSIDSFISWVLNKGDWETKMYGSTITCNINILDTIISYDVWNTGMRFYFKNKAVLAFKFEYYGLELKDLSVPNEFKKRYGNYSENTIYEYYIIDKLFTRLTQDIKQLIQQY